MSKKLIISLAPLLATAAFVVMPAVAQAAPHHWYKNNVLVPEGEKVFTVSWGTLALESAAGKVECKNVIGGYSENPIGGGAGVDAIQSFNAYECVDSCPVVFEVKAEKLPWPTELIEVAGVQRDQTKKVAIRFKCYLPGPPEEVFLNTVFEGNNDPATHNGTSAVKPSTVQYTVGTGEEELVSSEVGKGTTEGKVKTIGYETSEVITNK